MFSPVPSSQRLSDGELAAFDGEEFFQVPPSVRSDLLSSGSVLPHLEASLRAVGDVLGGELSGVDVSATPEMVSRLCMEAEAAGFPMERGEYGLMHFSLFPFAAWLISVVDWEVDGGASDVVVAECHFRAFSASVCVFVPPAHFSVSQAEVYVSLRRDGVEVWAAARAAAELG